MSEMFVIKTEGVLHTKSCKGAAVSKLSGISRFCTMERSFGLSSRVENVSYRTLGSSGEYS